MGIDIAIAPLLTDAVNYEHGKGDGLMLGRQQMFIPESRKARLMDRLKERGIAAEFENISGPLMFAEPFFETIGIPKIKSMDQNDFEGATYSHDLNHPIGDKYKSKFNFIFDGGTLEHVFNIPQALENVDKMLKKGGIFVSATCGDGWFGHGFWQMSPELVFSYWATVMGYEVLEVKEVPVRPRKTPYDIPDPRETGQRSKSKYAGERVYLWYVVRKVKISKSKKIAQQSDYKTTWDISKTA